MAARRKTRGPETQLAFEALAIEGGLLSADWLARVAQQKAGGQSDADYRVPKGINLRDDIGRYWRIAQAHWADFEKGRAAGAEPAALAKMFVRTLLEQCFGFASLENVPQVMLKERAYPIGSIALGTRVPVVVAPAGLGLDVPASMFGDGTRKRSAFGLAQEFLNASDDAMWGIASDGLTLRVLRDNVSLTRPAWIEVDLARIFAEERFADFAALWLLAHETRFGAKDRPPHECALETWRNAGREEGTRAREDLREGVEQAVLALANGFLSHADNASIRSALQSNALKTEAFFQELLRLVYRLIFLLTAEERGVLHAPDATESAKALYAEGYGMRRLRDRSARRNAYDRFGDVWESLKIVLRGLSRGETRLALPALGGLFDEDQCPTLDEAKLENRFLLLAVFRLSWLKDDASLSRVNWRDMGPEELGSVYESLLELVPVVSEGARQFGFATGGETMGNARKTTGSYYTPDSLVQVLLDSALEPVAEETIAKNPEPKHAVEALLDLSIVDPACGSGHFLLSAARRLAAHVARIEANGTPSAEQYRHALRQVVGRCIFGVDINPMAVELCKVSLWMEAVEPGRPLSFLDSHIQQGNALFGATPDLLANGIPEAAWEPIEGDDKKIASALKRQNKTERVALSLNLAPPPASTYARIGAGARAVDDASDANLDAVEQKEKDWRALVASAAYDHQRFVADLWCSAFVWRKESGSLRDLAPTESTFRAVQKEPARAARPLRDEVEQLRERYGFFHWHLAFPQVVGKGGFDIVLGNPPWDTLSPDRREYFSRFHGEMRSLGPSEQDAAIAQLLTDPAMAAGWSAHQRDLFGLVHFLKNSGRFGLYAKGNLAKGDFNVYRSFIELAVSMARRDRFVGQIIPAGFRGGGNVSAIRKHVLDRMTLKRVLGFINLSGEFFGGVHRQFQFMLYVAQNQGRTSSFSAAFGISSEAHLRRLQDELLTLDADTIRAQAPDTYAIPDVRSAGDVTVGAKMTNQYPAFGDAAAGPPFRDYQAELHMGNDRDLFTTDASGLPVFEGRMIAQYDHRAKTYQSGHGNSSVWIERRFSDPGKAIVPQWRVLPEKIPEKLGTRWRRYRLCFRDIAQPTDVRSFIAALVPPNVVCGDTVPTIVFDSEYEWAYLPWLAVANSFVMDAFARKKLSSPHFKFYIVDTLPFPRPRIDDAWVKTVAPVVLRLVCTSPEMTPFWNRMADVGFCETVDSGTTPAKALLVEEEREKARVLLDAIVAHDVYKLTRSEFADVLDTFPIVRKNDEKAHGEYRTKRIILEIYDAMAEAARTGAPYVTRLDPVPADLGVRHLSEEPRVKGRKAEM